MNSITPRLGLPLLSAGQAQKELVHNEALLQLDTVVASLGERIEGVFAHAIDAPAGGAVIDAEARAVIAEILALLGRFGPDEG